MARSPKDGHTLLVSYSIPLYTSRTIAPLSQQECERLAGKPGASIPNACQTWSETVAAYRFLSREGMSWGDVMQAHWQASEQRIAQHPVVLCVQTALALYMVIAWRINRLMRLGRALGDLPADLVFEPDEWKAAFILNKKPVPQKVPPLNTVIRLIAQRGGFLARKDDGEPGVKSIWLGL